MPLRSIRCALLIVWLGAAASGTAAAADAVANDVSAIDPSGKGGLITEAEISKAIQTLQSDPNLAGERKTRVLRWNKVEEEDEAEKLDEKRPAWLKWVGDFFKWLGESARVLVYMLAALLIAVLVVWLIRFVRGADLRRGTAVAFHAPTHVRDLDIRPESLPDDVGKAALELWERGERRPALSLLYRGLLSRLVHNHAVPIKHSSTEGECRVLALQRLPSGNHEYVALLIRVWQGAVYGATEPGDPTIRRLCREFAAALNSNSVATGIAHPKGVAA